MTLQQRRHGTRTSRVSRSCRRSNIRGSLISFGSGKGNQCAETANTSIFVWLYTAFDQTKNLCARHIRYCHDLGNSCTDDIQPNCFNAVQQILASLSFVCVRIYCGPQRYVLQIWWNQSVCESKFETTAMVN